MLPSEIKPINFVGLIVEVWIMNEMKMKTEDQKQTGNQAIEWIMKLIDEPAAIAWMDERIWVPNYERSIKARKESPASAN